MNLKTQSGRSMVEMLGTLAIIGVLSIGGIAGYSYGMDKYRCNKTINDISLRTVDLITQASQGRAELSFAEWKNEDSIYDFSNPAYSDDNFIMFDVGATNKIPQSVCEMLFEGLSNTAVQIDTNESVATSKDSCGEDNTMTFYFEGGGATTDTGATGEQCGGTVCGECQKCDATTETCVPVADYEQKCTTNDNKTGWCVRGTCEPDTTCNCGKGYYCTDTNDSCEQANPSGTCVEAKSKFKEKVINGITYYISNETMSWWDAVSACEALGNKKLLSPSDFVDGFDSTASNSQILTRTTLGDALYEAGWGSSGHPFILSSIIHNSCRAYIVDLHYDSVGPGDRNYSGYYAVCR